MSEFIIPKNNTNLGKVAQFAGVGNVAILNYYNPYDGRVPVSVAKDEKIGTSALGTPIYTDLTLKGCEYTDNISGETVTLPNDRYRRGQDSSVTGVSQNGGFYMNLETVLISIDQPIRVVKTEIAGRDGTVKEYIGKDDAQVTITGIITGANGVYPRDEVQRLKKWLDAPVSKEIVAWWMDNIGIGNIVIEGYTIPQVQGGYSYQMFTINAISDAPVELKIIQPIV